VNGQSSNRGAAPDIERGRVPLLARSGGSRQRSEMSAREGEAEVRLTCRDPMAGTDEIRRYRILRNVHVHGADRGMVWQGHGLADENRSFLGGRVFPPAKISFLCEVAAPGFSLTSASTEWRFPFAVTVLQFGGDLRRLGHGWSETRVQTH
jgi:hypothetical protein